jgi:hypothetical protein
MPDYRGLATKVFRFESRVVLWTLFGIAVLIVLVFLASFFLDPILTPRMQRAMNQNLKGYRVTLGNAHLTLLDGTLTLRNLVIRQEAHPRPPVAQIKTTVASIEWFGLFTGHVVADFTFEQPRLRYDLSQFSTEVHSKVPIQHKGWQQALLAVYPFKINRFDIEHGDVVYIDTDPQRPLHLVNLNLSARNIRNIYSPNRVYPSDFHASAGLDGQGRIALDGRGNFMAVPFPGVLTQYRISHAPLSTFDPEMKHVNLTLRGGILDSKGTVEYSPKIERVNINYVTIDGVNCGYVHIPQTSAEESKRVSKVGREVKKQNNRPGVQLTMRKLLIEHGECAYTDKAASPAYKLFVSGMTLKVSNLSNHFEHGPAKVNLTGKFMGSGNIHVEGVFLPETSGPDFTTKIAIEDTDLPSMNDLLRAYGKLEVAGGEFSMYSQMGVKNNEISGYVKPMFSNLKVYSSKQEKGKSIVHKAYVATVQGVSDILKNPDTQKVATETKIEGKLTSPNPRTWQAVVELIRNAFIEAILPGFDKEVKAANG